ncbi:hypothetical protein [Accumulibacter sp.]|uniref:hypothetical protein n=1 Tax=Accumulibacter sp. TaxID=2053492 RepID=UPI001ACD09E4|nr:hypothetical protein [Accumulibacter sp.]MBN8454563.1 hypothetical protein [Accumulibacter sp.]
MRRFAPILFLLVLAFGVPGAHAVVLGELRSSARVGQVLQAEIEVSEHPAERFDPAWGHDRCLPLQPKSLDEALVAWRPEQSCCDATNSLTSAH